MSRTITWQDRKANIKRWDFQLRLMAGHGFNSVFYTGAKGNPRAYEHHSGIWRISSCTYGKWKLERWTGRVYYPTGRGSGFKVWVAYDKRFDTPLAVALWFDLMRIALES